MRTTIRAAAAALTALLGAAAPAQDAPRRPNILFVFADDHALRAISALGPSLIRTPNIDRLAEQGIVFRNTFCGNSLCGPSRATVLTGKLSHQNGFRKNGDRFDGGQTTFPKLLQAAGYQTAMIGKWHLDSDPTGFDHWDVLPGQGQYYNPDFVSAAGRRRIEGYVTDVITDLSIDWLEHRDPDKPFLLMCQQKAPHRPWLPGPDELGALEDVEFPEPATLFDDYRGRGPAAAQHEMGIGEHLTMAYDLQCPVDPDEHYRNAYDSGLARMNEAQRQAWDAAFAAGNAAFAADPPTGEALVRWKLQRFLHDYLRCVAGVDKSVGRLLDWLAAHDLERDTLVVYSSDQGFYLGEHGWFDKRWMYEESFRMPLLMRWPARIGAGVESTALVQNIDFAPTFLEAAGVAVPAEVQGESLVPLFGGRTPADWRHSLYYHYYESRATHRVAAHEGVRTDRYKLLYFYEPEHDYYELYDLQNDPHELHSVFGAAEYAEVRTSMQRELERLRELYGVPPNQG